MKTRIIVYLLVVLLSCAVMMFRFFPSLWESDVISKVEAKEISSPVSSGEGSPILYAVFDLGGDGVTITPLGKSKIRFDHIGSGVRIESMWIGQNEALLALDVNGNGIVDNGLELVGNHFKTANSIKAQNSFLALSSLDGNHDGVIDVTDASYSKLMLWQDVNGDGQCDPSEMHTLEQIGIVSIKTEPASSSNAGASSIRIGSFALKDRASGAIMSRQFQEHNFKVETFRRSFVTPVAVSSEIEWLPDMGGSGLVRDLHEAASLSPILEKKLTAFAGAETRYEQLGMMDDLMAEWGKTSGMADMQTRAAQNGYVISTDLDSRTLAMITVLEQFYGRGFFAMPWEEHIGESAKQGLIVGWDGDPKHLKIKLSPAQLEPLVKAYKWLKDTAYKALIKQTRLKPYYDAIPKNETDGPMTINFNPVVETFSGRFQYNPEKVLVDLIEFNSLMKQDPKMDGWQENGSKLLHQLLAKVSPSAALQETLREFSIAYPSVGENGS